MASVGISQLAMFDDTRGYIPIVFPLYHNYIPINSQFYLVARVIRTIPNQPGSIIDQPITNQQGGLFAERLRGRFLPLAPYHWPWRQLNAQTLGKEKILSTASSCVFPFTFCTILHRYSTVLDEPKYLSHKWVCLWFL